MISPPVAFVPRFNKREKKQIKESDLNGPPDPRVGFGLEGSGEKPVVVVFVVICLLFNDSVSLAFFWSHCFLLLLCSLV